MQIAFTQYKYSLRDIPGLVEKVYYDGQMPVETFEDFSTGNDKLTRNFVGARGIEKMEMTQNSATTQAYPLYDTHGNMVATLSKNSLGTSWSLGNERSYDVWGSVRSGATTGGPKGRYCANLGHVQDDESGLIYMRARYYEPETGRFVSEDPARDGVNWFAYARSNPIKFVDYDGRVAEDLLERIFNWGIVGIAVGALNEMFYQFHETGNYFNNPGRIIGKALSTAILGAIVSVLGPSWVATTKAAFAAGLTGPERFAAVFAAVSYTVVLAMFIALTDLAFDEIISGAFGDK